MQPNNNKQTSSEKQPGLIEQGEIYNIQSPMVKEQENLLQKKQNIMQGLLSESA